MESEKCTYDICAKLKVHPYWLCTARTCGMCHAKGHHEGRCPKQTCYKCDLKGTAHWNCPRCSIYAGYVDSSEPELTTLAPKDEDPLPGVLNGTRAYKDIEPTEDEINKIVKFKKSPYEFSVTDEVESMMEVVEGKAREPEERQGPSSSSSEGSAAQIKLGSKRVHYPKPALPKPLNSIPP